MKQSAIDASEMSQERIESILKNYHKYDPGLLVSVLCEYIKRKMESGEK